MFRASKAPATDPLVLKYPSESYYEKSGNREKCPNRQVRLVDLSLPVPANMLCGSETFAELNNSPVMLNYGNGGQGYTFCHGGEDLLCRENEAYRKLVEECFFDVDVLQQETYTGYVCYSTICKGNKNYYFIRYAYKIHDILVKAILFALPVDVDRRDEILWTEVYFAPDAMYFHDDALYLTQQNAVPLKFSENLLTLECEITQPGSYLEMHNSLIGFNIRWKRGYELTSRTATTFPTEPMEVNMCTPTGEILFGATVPPFDVCIPLGSGRIVLIHTNPARIVVLNPDLTRRRIIDLDEINSSLDLYRVKFGGCMYVEKTNEVIFYINSELYVLRDI